MIFCDIIIRIYKIAELWKWFEKKVEKYLKFFLCHLKIDFFCINKHFFPIWNGVYSYISELDLSNKTIRIEKFHFGRKLWWKNCRKLSKLLSCRKEHSFQNFKDIDPKFRWHKLKTWIKIVSKFHFPILYAFRKIDRQRALRSGHLGQASGLVLDNDMDTPPPPQKENFWFFGPNNWETFWNEWNTIIFFSYCWVMVKIHQKLTIFWV